MRSLPRWTLLALLAAAAGAHAQSTVNLYGLMDLSMGSTKAPGGKAVKGVDNGQMTTSFLGFSGAEDLGGGLSAQFKVEHFLRADTGNAGRFNGDAFWARNAFVSLHSKDLGSIKLGRNTTPLFVSTLLFNALGDSFGYSPSIRHVFTSGTATGDSGWSDSVMINSSNLGGLTLGAIVAAGEGAHGRNWGVDALYFGGDFSGALVYQNVAKAGATAATDSKTWQAAGAYDMGSAKLFGQYTGVKTQADKFRMLSVGVSVPMGGGKFVAQFGKISADHAADRSTLSAGYYHTLSKRTELYMVGMRDKLQGLSAGAGYSVGVRHKF